MHARSSKAQRFCASLRRPVPPLLWSLCYARPANSGCNILVVCTAVSTIAARCLFRSSRIFRPSTRKTVSKKPSRFWNPPRVPSQPATQPPTNPSSHVPPTIPLRPSSSPPSVLPAASASATSASPAAATKVQTSTSASTAATPPFSPLPPLCASNPGTGSGVSCPRRACAIS